MRKIILGGQCENVGESKKRSIPGSPKTLGE